MLKGIGLDTTSNLAQTAIGKIQASLMRVLGDDTNAFVSGDLLISKEGGWQPATNVADL
jgi:hypothetical protein